MKDEELLQLQAFENDMLRAVADVCEKNHITYYIGCGTLLGAVRHKGFIPWDDDIDILMPYEDFVKFNQIAQNELCDNYFVQNNDTDKYWNRAYTTVRANGTTMMQESSRRLKMHQGVWLDIFPIAGMKSKREVTFKKKLLSLSNYFLMDDHLSSYKAELKKRLGIIGVCLLNLFFLIPFSVRQKLHTLVVKFVIGRKGKCKYIAEIWTSITDFFPADVFEGETSKVIFNGREYSAPPNWDKYLRLCYGEYMTPVRQYKYQDYLIVDLNNSYEKYMIK